MIHTEAKVSIYEMDGKDTPVLDAPEILVRSVSPLGERVEIEVGEHRYVVLRDDLAAALAATAHRGAL